MKRIRSVQLGGVSQGVYIIKGDKQGDGHGDGGTVWKSIQLEVYHRGCI